MNREGRARWTMTLRLYRLPSTIHDEHVRPSHLDYDTETLQTILYSTRRQVMPSSLDYDTETLQTTLTIQDEHVRQSTMGYNTETLQNILYYTR